MSRTRTLGQALLTVRIKNIWFCCAYSVGTHDTHYNGSVAAVTKIWCIHRHHYIYFFAFWNGTIRKSVQCLSDPIISQTCHNSRATEGSLESSLPWRRSYCQHRRIEPVTKVAGDGWGSSRPWVKRGSLKNKNYLFWLRFGLKIRGAGGLH